MKTCPPLRSWLRVVVTFIGVGLSVTACDSRPPLADGFAQPVADVKCNRCHGSAENFAPPNGLEDETETTDIGVGAHQAHLTDGDIATAFSCETCHIVPKAVEDEGHVDPLPAEVTFNLMATFDDHEPQWDRTEASCASTYCHSGKGATHPAPIWTQVDGTQKSCDSCHGAPPPPPHPDRKQCSACHSATVDPAGKILVESGLHINGVIDVDTLECNACHGNADNAAPPLDVAGESDTTFDGVGAHQAHLLPSDWHAPVDCETCHVVPKNIDDTGHIDDTEGAEIHFRAAAKIVGLEASYDGITCSNIYCHGGDNQDAQNSHPVWAQVDQTQERCESCHGNPPSTPPHVWDVNCATCHSDVIAPDGTFIAPELHVNGKVNYNVACNSCHGNSDNNAPPSSLNGDMDPSSPAVGAHQRHLLASATHGAVACTECHKVPSSPRAEGHLDDTRGAEINFGPLAGQDTDPSYSELTCSNTYCHGGTLNDDNASRITPVWNVIEDSQTACGTCHGLPPSAPHPVRQDCATCHAEVINADRTFANPALHVDGVVQSKGLECNSCHGTTIDGAPPLDTNGHTDTTFDGVGAHAVHLSGADHHAAVQCSDCHVVPTDPEDVGHYDTDLPAEITFGAAASAGGLSPNYDGVSCSNIACHGGNLTTTGATNRQPTWTEVTPTGVACDECHGFPPQGRHPQRTDCARCHGMVVNPDGSFLAPQMHIDGVVQSNGTSCNSCHGDDTNVAPPNDTLGNVDTTARGVGAHRSHLQDATWHKRVQCSECHKVPSAPYQAGHYDSALPAELTWGPLASNNGATPEFDGVTCSNVYCHGGDFVDGAGANTQPTWTAVGQGQASCGTCHGLPPQGTHPQELNCGACHPFNGLNPIDPNTHINGIVEVN